MEDSNSHSPPLAPDCDPSQASQQLPQVQSFQQHFVAPSSPLHAPQQSEQRRAATSRSRAGSVNKPTLYHPQPQPIRDAVDKAFGQSQPPNTLDPAFIAQVTEAVVKNLQSANLSQRTPAAQEVAQYPPPPSVHSVPQSPTFSSTASLPARYTPPSPQRGRDRAETRRRTSISPVSVFSDADNTIGKDSNYLGDSKLNDRDGDTPKPAFGETVIGSRLNASIREEQNAEDLYRVEEGRASNTLPHRRDSRDCVGSMPEAVKDRSHPPRVPSPLAEVTTLERIWQPLFDNGAPTVRLSQFLRGIANHIIEDYEPKASLVITPPKMLRFFEQTKIGNELYPWHLIFGGGMVSASISVMFRRLKCQHHLVQTQLHEVPNVPGLTPTGFEVFLTCLIQAHPDLEFGRLSNAVRDMPISNADYKTERFPKELSRRLLPAQPNPIAEQCIVASMAHEANLLQLKNSNAMPPPPSSAPPQQSAFPERERKPYSQSSFSVEPNDDLADVPSVPLERERKPYSAKEGAGKIFAPEGTRDEPSGANYPRPNDPASSRASRNAHYDYNNTGGPPFDARAAPPPRKHRSSVGPGMPPTGQTPSTGYAKGRRSPPAASSYVRSDPVNVGEISANQYASNLHSSRTQSQPDWEQEAQNYHANRHNSTPGNGGYDDETGRGKPIPNRGGQTPSSTGANNFDSPYGSVSAGSYSGPRARNYDRRSMYGGPPSMNAGGGPGGSDGWGSYSNGTPGNYPPQPGYGNPSMQH
jgi:hypothetical protein